MTSSPVEPWKRSKWITKTDAAYYIHQDVGDVQRLIDDGVLQASPAKSRRAGRGQSSRVLYLNIDDLDAYMRARADEYHAEMSLAAEGPGVDVAAIRAKPAPKRPSFPPNGDEPRTYPPIMIMAREAVERSERRRAAREKRKEVGA